MIHIKIIFKCLLDFVHIFVYKFSSSSQKISHYPYLSRKVFFPLLLQKLIKNKLQI